MIWSGRYRQLVIERIKFRKHKMYQLADQCRRRLEVFGIEIRQEFKQEYLGETVDVVFWRPRDSWAQETTWW